MKIEKNIPIPTGRLGSYGSYSFVGDMEIGDSVVVANQKEANAVRQAMLRRFGGGSAFVRTINGEMRIWRIDPNN